MLFNSYEFIFCLLPIAYLGNRLLQEHQGWRVGWLLACSFVFYAWWNPVYVPLLAASIGVNYWIGSRLRVSASRSLLAQRRSSLARPVALPRKENGAQSVLATGG